ncbi:lysophospholipid acyltransferase family protein [Candidatus Pelagibacter sp.]|jgi:KDO2-lipid IV(A) lauroyltransferase|nr:lysophospholipid acyltransferase family protein [Candidatus Pelagibacter sp.]
MNSIKYFFQFLIIFFLFIVFKILGLNIASNFSSALLKVFGPLFRSKKLINQNILKAFPTINHADLNKIHTNMWGNYGRILSEYVFLKDFRQSESISNLEIIGQDILDEIKKDGKPVIFISGHFNNFELMAMHIEKSGINLAAIYRPLNNKFLNFIMEKIRKKYICRNQIKKGIAGTRQLLSYFKKNYSIALMIDQRVSQGIKSNFFKNEAYTTTIPAQFSKKFNCKIVPIYIERINKVNFKLTVNQPLEYSNKSSIEDITLDLNRTIEKMILENPDQWIWSHNRWK